MITLTLRWAHGGHEHERALGQGESAVIGRSPDADVTLPAEDRMIHRRHAQLSWSEGGPVVTVLGNNGVRLASQDRTLQKGESGRVGAADRLTLGSTEVHLRVDSQQRRLGIRCHNCANVLPYEPHEMCPHCGMALAVGSTVEY